VCGQGLLLQQDRGLLHRLADEVGRGRLRVAQRNRAPLPGRDDLSLRYRQSTQVQEGRADPERTTACSARWGGSDPRETKPLWSFLTLLQKNVLDTRRWNTREDLRLAIVV
jgi:hypothetical protein